MEKSHYYINIALDELSKSDTFYVMLKDLSFMDHASDNQHYQKVKVMLIKSDAFEEHTGHAIRMSPIGLLALEEYGSWNEYRADLKNKKEIKDKRESDAANLTDKMIRSYNRKFFHHTITVLITLVVTVLGTVLVNKLSEQETETESQSINPDFEILNDYPDTCHLDSL